MIQPPRRHPWSTVALLVALVALAAAAPGAVAQNLAPQPLDVDTEAGEIFNAVMSPYCPGVLLAGCGSSAAAALRDSIKVHLRRGDTRQEIIDNLVAVYGEDVLGMPSYRGTSSLVWLLPGLALALGLGGAYWWVLQCRQTPPPAAPPPARVDEALRRKLETELEDLR
ncbi:MAG: cytochrome c-type biogenesis protein CcmH [Gemmatimonadota bacterium]